MDTSLYFYGSRYYDPALGRLVSADNMVGRPTQPQALNRYSYTFNDPLRLIDPSGYEPEDRPEHEPPPEHSDNSGGNENNSSRDHSDSTGQEKDTIESNFTNSGETNSDGLAQLDNEITSASAPDFPIGNGDPIVLASGGLPCPEESCELKGAGGAGGAVPPGNDLPRANVGGGSVTDKVVKEGLVTGSGKPY